MQHDVVARQLPPHTPREAQLLRTNMNIFLVCAKTQSSSACSSSLFSDHFPSNFAARSNESFLQLRKKLFCEMFSDSATTSQSKISRKRPVFLTFRDSEHCRNSSRIPWGVTRSPWHWRKLMLFGSRRPMWMSQSSLMAWLLLMTIVLPVRTGAELTSGLAGVKICVTAHVESTGLRKTIHAVCAYTVRRPSQFC